ncbi:MAG: polysaccharide biosynthesis protein, partial [Pseudomonadota bacterium]|nr:polysaccharide biosynthesis protein [Pseudomonadota bacterium]
MFDNKIILITGGTGSFGRHYTKTLLERYSPKKIIIFSRDELKQFEMSQEFNQPCMRYVIGDVRVRECLEQACRGVDYIIHAAVLNQAPASKYNSTAYIKTNVNSAENVIHAAICNNVSKVIALSTGKAADPTNLYDETEVCSDKLFVSSNYMAGNGSTSFSVARYGNIVGIGGAVVPVFLDQIGNVVGHVVLADSNTIRFGISVQQCVDFVLTCFCRMHGGEIFLSENPLVGVEDPDEVQVPDRSCKVVGHRKGEKLHGKVTPREGSYRTIKFGSRLEIELTTEFAGDGNKYELNARG